MAKKFDLEEFKERLFISVVNYFENRDILNNVPHEVKGDFALIPRVCLGNKSDAGIYSESALVNDELLLEMEIDMDTVMDIAKSNSKNIFPGKICSITDYLDPSEGGMAPDGVVVPQVYVLTNNAGINGAAAFFYQPDLVENLSSMIEKDLLIFPSGENEMFCIPVTGQTQLGELQEMYTEAISELGLDEEKPLSANVLKYDSLTHMVQQMDGSSFSLSENVNNVPRVRHSSR